MNQPSNTPPQGIPQALPYHAFAPAAAPETLSCPLCGRALRRKPVRLNGFPVCKRCRNSFANRRQGAFLIDLALLRIVEYGLVTLVLYLSAFGGGPRGAGINFFGLYTGILLNIPFLLKDAIKGMSPGKWLCGVQVVDRTSLQPIGAMQSLKRNLVMLIPFVGVLVPAFQLIAGPRWGDKWANTVVVWCKYAHKLPFDPRGNFCQACGYDLTGNVSGTCPECGTPLPMVKPINV